MKRNMNISSDLFGACLSIATTVDAQVDITAASEVVVASVPGTSLVTEGTSTLTEHVATASVAHGRLPARVFLTVCLSATFDKRCVCLFLEVSFH